MGCPRCTSALTEQTISDGNRLLCSACGGFWIDPEPLASALRKRGAVLPEAGGVVGNLRCPRDGAWLVNVSFQGIELDRCTQCGGLWLDKGEWEKVSAVRRGVVNAGAGAVGVAAIGGETVAATAMQQPAQQETASRTADIVGEVAGGFFECLCDIVTSIDL